jgi:hypothetical protein
MIIYFLMVFGMGYFLARLGTESRVSLGRVVLLGLGSMGLIGFWSLLVWQKIVWEGLFCFVSFFIIGIVFLLRKSGKQIFIPCCFSILDLLVLCLFYSAATSFPEGQWDAWGFWNLKAKFLYSGGTWTDIFIGTSHPDYPLLLPSVVGGGWALGKTESFMWPLWVGVFFHWSLFLIVKEEFAKILKREWWGYVGSFFLLGSPCFIILSASQYADIPLAACLFLAIVLLFRNDNPANWFLSGLVFGFAIFLKNEGLLWLAISGMAFCGARMVFPKRITFDKFILWGLGFLPSLISLLIVKRSAPMGDCIAYLLSSSPMRSLHRIWPVIDGIFLIMRDSLFWRGGWILGISLLVLVRWQLKTRDFWDIFGDILLITWFIVLVIIYTFSPYNIDWYLGTTLYRLLLQGYPLFLLFVCRSLKRLWDQLQ